MKPYRILVAHDVPQDMRGGMSKIMGKLHSQLDPLTFQTEYFARAQLSEKTPARFRRFVFPLAVVQHVRKMARQGKPIDLVNVHEPAAHALILLKRFAGNVPIVVTSHGVESRSTRVMAEDATHRRGTYTLRNRINRRSTVDIPANWSLKHADHVFCLNEEDQAYLQMRLRIRGDKITRIFPSADNDYFEAFSRRDYSNQRPPIILWFGTWLIRKGVPDIVAALPKLTVEFPGLKLKVMGSGMPKAKVLESFPESLRAAVEYVVRPDANEQQFYVEQVLEASVFIQPSVFEGTPLTLMETMATGLPPVVTDTCGMRDVVQNEMNGFVIPLRSPEHLIDAVSRILRCRQLQRKLGEAAHQTVEQNYTWEQNAVSVDQAYRRILESRGVDHKPGRTGR
jgi:glycosyltransferase involved in cell wall biosynthesis